MKCGKLISMDFLHFPHFDGFAVTFSVEAFSYISIIRFLQFPLYSDSYQRSVLTWKICIQAFAKRKWTIYWISGLTSGISCAGVPLKPYLSMTEMFSNRNKSGKFPCGATLLHNFEFSITNYKSVRKYVRCATEPFV